MGLNHHDVLAEIDARIGLSEMTIPVNEAHRLAAYRDPIPDKFPAEDMLIKGAVSAKLTFFGAYAGAGKTTALVPYCAVIAGLNEVPGLDIYAWRRVVYLSEHPEQFEKSLRAFSLALDIDPAIVSDRIRIVETARMDKLHIVAAIPDWLELTERHTVNGVTVDFPPLVVMDTFAATVQMRDENSNTEGSDAIALFKEEFNRYGMALNIVAHTPKANKNGSAGKMTIRGAGAFEGDAQQVMFLDKADSGARTILIAEYKHRFTPTVEAIKVHYHTQKIAVVDMFGQEAFENVGYCTLEPITAKARQAETDAKKAAEKAAQALLDGQFEKDIIEVTRKLIREGELSRFVVTRNKIYEALSETGLGRAKPEVLRKIDELIAMGQITEEPITTEMKARLKAHGYSLSGNTKRSITKAVFNGFETDSESAQIQAQITGAG